MVKHIALLVVIAGICIGCGSVTLTEIPADGGTAGSGSAGNAGTAAEMARGGSSGSGQPAGSAGAQSVSDAGTAGDGKMDKLPFEGGSAGTAGSSPDGSVTEASHNPDAGSAGSSACDADVPVSENFNMTACGYSSTDSTGHPAGPSTTIHEYSDLVTMKISGLILAAPTNPLGMADAFYNVDPNDTSIMVKDGACPKCLSYNRPSEGACVCSDMYMGCQSYYLSDLIVGAYPTFNPAHEYTVTLNFGNGMPSKINLGISDCGCSDNSGVMSVTLTPVASVCR